MSTRKSAPPERGGFVWDFSMKWMLLLVLVVIGVGTLMATAGASFCLQVSSDVAKGDGWHVDHIGPCASFDLTDEEQKLACSN